MDTTTARTAAVRALVVDDDRMCRRLFAAVLQSALGEVQLATADSGTRALARLAASPFEIVITDLHLPGANGIQVARSARRANPHAVVVVATGGGTAEQEREALAAGASLWLTKPFAIDDLIEFLRASDVPIERIPRLERIPQRADS